jgi:hypothetical protein
MCLRKSSFSLIRKFICLHFNGQNIRFAVDTELDEPATSSSNRLWIVHTKVAANDRENHLQCVENAYHEKGVAKAKDETFNETSDNL